MLVKLTPAVNVTNIVLAYFFASHHLIKKSREQTVSTEKLHIALSYNKANVKCLMKLKPAQKC